MFVCSLQHGFTNATFHANFITPKQLPAVVEDDPRRELTAVEAEVRKLTAKLTQLMSKTHVLKARINNSDSSILRLLPSEVIAEIFLFCIPPVTCGVNNHREPAAPDPDIDAFTPFKLGTICSAWRRIAWSSPRLWTSITLRLNNRNIKGQLELLGAWLARSGELPLSIRLDSEEENHWTPPASPATALEVVNKYAHRWHDLDLRIPTTCYAYLPRPEVPLPLLASLNLNPPGGQGERRHTVEMLQSVQLSSISLSSVYLISMKFNWDQITDLHLEAFYVDECLTTLCRTPNIVTCSLRNVIGGDDGHTLPSTPIVLEYLKTLNIDNEKNTSISLLLDSIQIPNATEINFAGRNLVHVPQICSLISRSPSLRTFSLLRMTIPGQHLLLQILESLKTVTNLRLDIPPVYPDRSGHSASLNDRVFEQCNPILALAEQKECLLPSLEVFEYHGPQSFTWPTILTTLESRRPSGLWDPNKEFVIRQGSVSDWRSFELFISKRDANVVTHTDSILTQLRGLSTNGLKMGLVIDVPIPEDETNTKPQRFI